MSPVTWRAWVPRALVLVGVAVAALAIAAGYVRWQAFDDDTFDGTAAALIDNEAIRSEVAATAVERLFASVDVERELEARLPTDQQRLAGPIAAGLRELAEQIAFEMLARPRTQALWRQAVATAHDELLAVLRDEPGAVDILGTSVVLDLRPLVLELAERLAITADLADRLPEDAGAIRIMDADQLERAQDLTARFETLARWIWVVPFVLWALAVLLAPGRRRIELRAIALGLIAAGSLVLLGRSLAGVYVVDELAATTAARGAAEDAWRIVTELLSDGAWAVITAGLVALVGVWLAGPTRSGTAARRWLSPVMAQWQLAYGATAFLFLLFVWWGPFVQARRPLYLVVTAALLAVGVESLRRGTARELPAAKRPGAAELLRPIGQLVAGRRPGNALPEELERLADLRERGALTDDEFVAAKRSLLGR